MIQYPGSKKAYQKPDQNGSKSGLGMSLEADINKSNAYYRFHDVAIIHKKPTPIQIVSVDYPSRNKAKITEAYFRTASTTDYQGVYKGLAIDFEAKETKNKTLFPLKDLHQHQLDHLEAVHKHGAVAFLIIRFYSIDKTFLLFAKELLDFIAKDEKRSLSVDWLEIHAHAVYSTYQIPCDYCKTIAEVIHKESI